MDYINRVIEKLGEREHDIERFFDEWIFKPFGIKKGVITKENIRPLFLFCMSAQAFQKTVKKKEGYGISLKEFDSKFDEIIKNMSDLNDGNKKIKHNYLFDTIKSMPQMGYKNTSLFLKILVLYLKIWPELKDELYVPIDVHIGRILLDKLKILDENNGIVGYKDNKVEIFSPYSKKKFLRFQENLNSIHRPRIMFDHLWFIGFVFCGKRVFCDYCWIKDDCKNRWDKPDIES